MLQKFPGSHSSPAKNLHYRKAKVSSMPVTFNPALFPTHRFHDSSGCPPH